MFKISCLEFLDENNYQQGENTCYYKKIHFSMQLSAKVNRYIVKA